MWLGSDIIRLDLGSQQQSIPITQEHVGIIRGEERDEENLGLIVSVINNILFCLTYVISFLGVLLQSTTSWVALKNTHTETFCTVLKTRSPKSSCQQNHNLRKNLFHTFL